MPFTINVQVDDSELLSRMHNGEKRLAYAVVNAINNTAIRIQSDVQAGVEQRFLVRDPAFLLRQAAVIKPFASVGQGRPYAEISVGQKDRLLLSEFESGGERLAFVGQHPAIPISGGPARPTFSGRVPPEFTFQGLRIVATGPRGEPQRTASGRLRRRKARGLQFRRSFTATGKTQLKGEQRTFILSHSASLPSGGVLQRIGPGRGDLRLVYEFATGEQIKPRLQFVATAEATAARWFGEEMQKQVIDAVTHEAGRA